MDGDKNDQWIVKVSSGLSNIDNLNIHFYTEEKEANKNVGHPDKTLF